MIHFDMFIGTEYCALTDRPIRLYMRRGDLLDLTEHVDAALLSAGDYSMSSHASFAYDDGG